MEDDKRPTIADGPRAFDLEDRNETLIGAEVGGYVIEAELGRGGMGVVYAATHPLIGKRAAIKVLKHSLSNNPATVERFLQEARSVNQIGHPNIVDIFAFGALDDGRSYLVMDLLEGEPLRKRVKRGKLPVEEAAPLIDEIASALEAAHAKGFIHRDLKPDNVFLVKHSGRVDVKLLDFGLAKLAANATMARAFRTATGAMLGTPDYMSPEQLRGENVDHRTDIYALGVVAFELLSGGRPRRYRDGTFELEGMTVASALQQVRGVTPELADLVGTMMEADMERRPTLAAVRNVIKRIRRSLPHDMVAPAASPAMLGARPMPATQTVQLPSDPSPYEDDDPLAEPPLPMPPTIRQQSVAPTSRPPRMPSEPPISQQSQPPLSRPPSQPPLSQPPLSQPPRSGPVSQQPAAGLRVGAGIHASTKLGVAPPPGRPGQPHPVTAARRVSESKVWLVLGLVLVVASAVALVVVLTT